MNDFQSESYSSSQRRPFFTSEHKFFRMRLVVLLCVVAMLAIEVVQSQIVVRVKGGDGMGKRMANDEIDLNSNTNSNDDHSSKPIGKFRNRRVAANDKAPGQMDSDKKSAPKHRRGPIPTKTPKMPTKTPKRPTTTASPKS